MQDCALVSPYLQQDPPGGYLASSISKHHHEPIFKFVFANDFLFSYSRSLICVYKFERTEARQTFLFDVELPSKEKLKEFLGTSSKMISTKNNEDASKINLKVKCLEN